jgi:opacity protein-like surface antigen
MPISRDRDMSLRFRRFSFYLMKSLLIGAASAVAFAPAAIAGPFINIENNAGFSGAGDEGLDFVGSATDFHLGIEGSSDNLSGGIQAGPMLMAPENAETTVELSGKAFGSVALSPKADLYGEISFATAEEMDYANFGTKVGVKFKL